MDLHRSRVLGGAFCQPQHKFHDNHCQFTRSQRSAADRVGSCAASVSLPAAQLAAHSLLHAACCTLLQSRLHKPRYGEPRLGVQLCRFTPARHDGGTQICSWVEQSMQKKRTGLLSNEKYFTSQKRRFELICLGGCTPSQEDSWAAS